MSSVAKPDENDWLKFIKKAEDGKHYSVKKTKLWIGSDIDGLPLPPQLWIGSNFDGLRWSGNNLDPLKSERELAIASTRAAMERLERDDNGQPFLIGAISSLIAGLVGLGLGDRQLNADLSPYLFALIAVLVILFWASRASTKVAGQVATLKAMIFLWEQDGFPEVDKGD